MVDVVDPEGLHAEAVLLVDKALINVCCLNPDTIPMI